MTEKDQRSPGGLVLPKLKPRSRAESLFNRNIAAVVEAGAADNQPLEQQVLIVGSAAPKPSIRDAKEEQTARVHTRIPMPLMVDLQVYCARNRITMQALVHRLLADFLASTES